jgi:uncharacterized membrane protein
LSIESGRKFGFFASLINIILPIVAIGGAVAWFVSLIVTSTTGIVNGTASSAFAGVFGEFIILIIFIVIIAAVGIAGYIMFMYAMYSLSNYYSEPTIFKNVLYAFIINIVSAVVIFILQFAVIISSITGIYQNPPPTPPPFTLFALPYVVAIGVSIVFALVNGLLYMRAFNKLKEKSGVDNFGTAGLLYIIGAIIPLVAWIAWIFAAMGFNRLKPVLVSTSTFSYPAQPSSTFAQMKHCTNCGTENTPDSLYCHTCGKSL